MVRIPSPESITGPASLRPSGPAPVADMSGLTRGVENLAGSLGRVVANEREKQNVIDFAAADAFATKSFLDMQNQFERDPEYATIGERAERGSQDISGKAGALIRDPKARQQWVAANETTRIRQVDALGDIGRTKANEAEKVNFGNSLQEYARLITEPTTPADVRDRARQSLSGTIDVALDNGLLTPADAATFRQNYIDKSEQQLAINTADALIRTDPNAVKGMLGIGPTGDAMTDARNASRLPIVAAPGVNVADVDVAVLGRFEQVQSAFGAQLPVISGVRDPAKNAAVGGADQSRHMEDQGGDAIDIDVSSLSKEERVRFIETASAMGFNGIGVYANSLHLDTGAKRVWGPSHGGDSVPAWAKDVLARHTGGGIAQVPVAAARNVDPRFAALDYSQRSALFDRAKQESERVDMDARVAVQATVENMPTAIARQGEYTGVIPTPNDFVAAYGAVEGMQRSEAFDASIKVARDTFAMRTMTADQIASLVQEATPTSTGNDAALEEARYTQTAQAADATIKAREADPVGYVQSVYPAVSNAWQGVDEPGGYAKAVAVTAMAQEQLGIKNQMLIPAEIAKGAATTFNDISLPVNDRLGALSQLVLGTQNETHQAQIYEQLVKEGVPETTRGAMDALARGDEGAALRLFSAAMVDPKAIPDKPGGLSSSDITGGIAELMEPGQILDVAFELSGSPTNFATSEPDVALITQSVKLRLADGTAGGNLQRAIDMTVKDMFGDVEVVTGSASGGKAGMKMTLPKGADRNAYQTGFDTMLGEVGAALASDLDRDKNAAFGPASGWEVQRRQIETGNYVEQALSGGYFTNAGDDSFKFIDPNSGSAVQDMSGEDLIFSRTDILAAGTAPPPIARAGNSASDAGAAFGASVIRPQGQ